VSLHDGKKEEKEIKTTKNSQAVDLKSYSERKGRISSTVQVFDSFLVFVFSKEMNGGSFLYSLPQRCRDQDVREEA